MFTFRAQEVRHYPGITFITIIKRLFSQIQPDLRQGRRQQ
jgi:hypothetical protein